jgi:RNA polymerase primary sigma factor
MDPISIYIKELKNENSTKEESIELILKARAGDEVSKERLAKNYLLFVVKIAKEYNNMGIPLSDLISEGNVGLLKAIEKYDPDRGPFSTCARLWIKQSIIRNCMHKKTLIRLPENVSELIRTNRYEGTIHREVSIDAQNEDGESLTDKIPDNDDSGVSIYAKEEQILMKKKVGKILSTLQPRDRQILEALYGINIDEPLDLHKVAEQFNLTPTRIGQIVKNSLKMMKIAHESLEGTSTKDIQIISAVYGAYEYTVDVTLKVRNLYSSKENIKSSNKLGGDPIHGTVKHLTIQYSQNGQILTKSFKEGTIVKL